MPFSFLHPWFLLGALGIAAPIWLHLRRKKQTNLVQFSAVRFLEDEPHPRQSPLALRDLLLLALRILALLALVAALAWPYLRGAATAAIRESRVYILDNTFSHQAAGGFVRDRDRLLDELSRSAGNVQIAVVELLSTPRVLVPFGEDREGAKQKVKALEPSFQRGSFLAAFRQAQSLLANSLGVERRIVFLTDNQQNQWSEAVSTPPFLRNVQVDLPRVEKALLPNLSLSEPRVQRIFLGDKSLVNFTLKLRHDGEAKTANIVLHANDQLILNRAVDLDQQPETILLQAQWEADPAAWVRGVAEIQGAPDALAGDNRSFFSLPPVVEGRVALLAQSSYLRLALSREVMRGQWAARTLEPAQLDKELAANEDADVLCIESNYLQSSAARKLLWRYLTNGRGVILLVNRLTPSIAGFLRELGFEAADNKLTAPPGGAKFQYIFSGHPVFHPFLAPDFGNLLDIRVFKYTPLKAAQAMPLIFSDQGAPLFFQGTKAQGKLFVAAFGLDREHTSWPVHQTFIPFLDLALQAARVEDATPVNFEPGDLCQVTPSTAINVRQVVLRDQTRELARATVEQGIARLHVPSQPGLYSLTYDENAAVEKMLNVNPPVKESVLEYSASPETLNTWTARMPATAGPVRKTEPAGSQTAILQQLFWWWMVVAGFLALMLEMTLAEVKSIKLN
jgi:hypothetical protein